MILEPSQAQAFLQIYKALLNFIFIREFGDEATSMENYRDARNILFDDKSIIDEFLSAAKGLTNSDLETLRSIKNGFKDTFVYMKTLKKYSVLMRDSNGDFYCVSGINDPLNELIPNNFTLIETVVLNFDNKIICDGLISYLNVQVGPNLRKDINYNYKLAKEQKRLVNHITNG